MLGYFVGHAFGYNKGYTEGWDQCVYISKNVDDMHRLFNEGRKNEEIKCTKD